MAATDLAAIIAVFRQVCEAVELVATSQPFTHDRQPNAAIQDSYWIEDGGAISRESQTNYAETRVDRLVVWIAKPLAFAGAAQFEALEQLGDTLYRALVAEGTVQGWNVEAENRRLTNPRNTELVVGSFAFRVDYDFSASVQ